MLQYLYIFVIKIFFGVTLGLLGTYTTKKKNKKMVRIFDELSIEQQQGILYTCISYAKGEIAELNLPATTDIIDLAVQYDTMYFLQIIDFAGQDIETIPSFVGGRPVKRP